MLTKLITPPRRLWVRALDNARSAADSLHAHVEARRQLAPVEADVAQGLVGELARLSRAECVLLLRSRTIGRLAYISRGDVPDIVPVNYMLEGADRILIRSGPGPKLQAASRAATVAFEVDDLDDASRTGWSVVATALASVLTSAERAALRQRPEPWALGPRDEIIALRVKRIEGRRLS